MHFDLKGPFEVYENKPCWRTQPLLEMIAEARVRIVDEILILDKLPGQKVFLAFSDSSYKPTIG